MTSGGHRPHRWCLPAESQADTAGYSAALPVAEGPVGPQASILRPYPSRLTWRQVANLPSRSCTGRGRLPSLRRSRQGPPDRVARSPVCSDRTVLRCAACVTACANGRQEAGIRGHERRPVRRAALCEKGKRSRDDLTHASHPCGHSLQGRRARSPVHGPALFWRFGCPCPCWHGWGGSDS